MKTWKQFKAMAIAAILSIAVGFTALFMVACDINPDDSNDDSAVSVPGDTLAEKLAWLKTNAQINDFLACDVLIIDDLGAEPIIKNVTQEHIYNILNERATTRRAVIITTNLNPSALIDRYDQRIASRILAKENSTIIEFPKSDLRI